MNSVLFSALALFLLSLLPLNASAFNRAGLSPSVPGWFDPDEDLRAPKPYRAFGVDSLAGFNVEGILFRIETELDSARGYYISTRELFGREYGRPIVESRETYREDRFKRDRVKFLKDDFLERIKRPSANAGQDAIEIQVPFKIQNKTFRRIFGGDRVGLRVSGKITVDGGLRRETSDQVVTTQTDQANYNFKIDQTQQFRIVGKVGDKVSVEIDQDSERVFEFENNVKLEYTGYEDEIIQSIEAGNVSLTLPGTQLATLTAKNEGLFGFKTVSKVGALSITTIASLQNGEKNKLSYTGGSESQTKRVNDIDYVTNQYFFLDPVYRETFPTFTLDYVRQAQQAEISNLEVYRSVTGAADVSTLLEGIAIYDESITNKVPDVSGLTVEELSDFVDSLSADTELQSADWVERGFFKKLEEGSDYEYHKDFGYIRLRYAAQANEVIGVSYTVNGQHVGVNNINFPGGNKTVLKLIKPTSPKPSNPTWDLEWKHVYWVGTTNLKEGDFDFRILRNNTEQSQTNAQNKSWLEVFGLDVFNSDGAKTPDGIIDAQWVRLGDGEIHFPDLRPFDPDGYVVGGDSVYIDLTDELRNPNIYDVLPNSGVTIEKKFVLESEYSNTSANINLGINVLEGSEEVFLNGALLKKDQDYIIDYLSGQITILNEAAFDPNANLEIKYESGEVFQLDQRTMLGIRLEYALWEDSFIGLTLLNFNEKPIEKRVKVGNEPLQNFIWDANTRLRFHPYFMTQMVNAIPLISTDEPSEVVFEGEIAQVFPNPNSLNNSSTGDNDGVAYIDDFEASQRATPLGVRRKNWYAASHPVHLPFWNQKMTGNDNNDFRMRLYWWNPYKQIPITDIWPNREVNSNVPNNTDVLSLRFDPEVNNLRRADVEPEDTWNGIMRSLSAGFHNQSNTKFIEVWMQWNGQGGPNAAIYFDMGQVSEDVIPNGTLDSEDVPLYSDSNIGNKILDDGEDIGIDGIEKNDPPWRIGSETNGDPWTVENEGYDYANESYDWWDINGNGVHDAGDGTLSNPPEPFSSDDWSFSASSPNDVDRINGTQNNQDDEARYPDTEDLDGDLNLNQANNFFRYQFRLNDAEHFAKYVRGGQSNPKKWYLVRIPIEDVFDEVNEPDLTQIEFFRVWATGLSSPASVQIAQIELVGNEWLEDPIVNPVTGDTTVYVTATTINTYDNSEDYNPPPGVAGEIDPITDIRSKEQSLVMSLRDIPTAVEGQLIKYLYNEQDLREYRQLKMFVNGGGRNPLALENKDLEFFLRFGSGLEGSNLGYYEYSLPLKPGWDENNIEINLDRLTSLKKKAEEAGEDFAYETLANGHTMKVIGTPSIGSVNLYAVGVRNNGRPVSSDEGIEIWVDELRLSGVRKERGMAMRSSLDMSFADFFDLQTNIRQSDAEFHQVDQRSGSDQSSIDASVSGSLQLDKFLDPSLGVRLPLRGTVSSKLDIPKYTSGNGDVRTESLVDQGELNVWKRYGDMALSKEHYNDKYLRNDNGGVVVDETTGIPLQDRSAWGVDTLFTTSQNYSWSLNYSKSGQSGHWLPKYTIDKLSSSYSRSEKYSSSLSYQYQKTFTNNGSVSYSLPLERQELDIFGWTERIPVLQTLADSKFNYLPTRVNGGVDASETSKSQKYRNALERPSYQLGMTRDWGTSFSPFRPLSFDYDYSIQSQHVRQDSSRQQILYDDQPDEVRQRVFDPGTTDLTMVEELISQLQDTGTFGNDGQDIANEAQTMLNNGDAPADILDFIYAEAAQRLPGDLASFLKQPWDRIPSDDPRYSETFWSALNLPFADTQKTQNVRFNYSPNIVSWLTTSMDYSSRYTWSWSGFKYTGRSIQTSNNLGGSMSFRLRQILPAERGEGSVQDQQERDFARLLGREEETEGEEGEEGDEEEQGPTDEERMRANQQAILRAINPVNLGLGFLRRLQDIRLNYNQSTSFNTPGVEDGTPSWEYRLGFTGNSGLNQVPNISSVTTANRTDDYRLSSGVDWTTRLSTSIDYNIKFSQSTGNKVSGQTTRSAFYLFNKDDESLTALDIPNYTVRWSGLEQFGPLQNIAQTISFDHSYRGETSESWERVVQPDSLGGIRRQVQSRAFSRQFSPLAGFNITWMHSISTTARYNWSQRYNVTASNNTKTRNTEQSITLSVNYTRKTGFRIPIPVWPFKNKRFDNETTFALSFDRTASRNETQREGSGFEMTDERLSWSLGPNVNYRFSRNVSGSIRYKYGVTETVTNTTKYQEFGINVQINIRG
ncbi:cell surface protein SprA [bacterium]|nr:cell surface protein SprA [bacterium]